MDEFLKRCFYHSGQYSSEEDFSELDRKLKEKEVICELLFYLICDFPLVTIIISY